MYKRIFLRGDSRNYRVRYRLSNGPRIYDVSLHTHIKEVAEKKAEVLILDQERELLGIGLPKAAREAATRSVAEQVEEFIANLEARHRGKSHVIHARGRLRRLVKECKWRHLRDVTAERLNTWLEHQDDLSVKTRNEYLAHATAFVNWAVREGRLLHNPLKSVVKKPAKGNETFRRRALTVEELVKLVQRDRKRGLAYLVAGCTGLRRGEMRQLLWSDIRLDEARPFIDVRASTTKSKRAAVIPLVPMLVDALRAAKAKGVDFTGLVFPRGLPSVRMLAKDLDACGIPVEDERGFRVDFHALRHTFASILANVGVSELVRVKLARHSEWRQTDRYTDAASLPLFAEMEKFASVMPGGQPSPIPSLFSGKKGPKSANPDQTGVPGSSAEIIAMPSESANLPKAVPSWDRDEVVPKGGLEPPCG